MSVSLDLGGAVTPIAGIRVVAVSDGVVVVGTGSDATTITLATTGPANVSDSAGRAGQD